MQYLLDGFGKSVESSQAVGAVNSVHLEKIMHLIKIILIAIVVTLCLGSASAKADGCCCSGTWNPTGSCE